MDDLLALICSHPLDPHVGGVDEEEIVSMKTKVGVLGGGGGTGRGGGRVEAARALRASPHPPPPHPAPPLRAQYNNLLYQALRNCVVNSLNAIKKRVCSRASSGFLYLERPFFISDVQLAVPSVRCASQGAGGVAWGRRTRDTTTPFTPPPHSTPHPTPHSTRAHPSLSPSIEDVQRTINKVCGSGGRDAMATGPQCSRRRRRPPPHPYHPHPGCARRASVHAVRVRLGSGAPASGEAPYHVRAHRAGPRDRACGVAADGRGAGHQEGGECVPVNVRQVRLAVEGRHGGGLQAVRGHQPTAGGLPKRAAPAGVDRERDHAHPGAGGGWGGVDEGCRGWGGGSGYGHVRSSRFVHPPPPFRTPPGPRAGSRCTTSAP